MINIQTIEQVSNSPDFASFSRFVINNLIEKTVVKLDIADFMKIPGLMNRVFIIDVIPDKTRKLQFRYTGTMLDKEFDMNLMGHYFEDVYTGSNRDLIIGSLNDVITTHQVSYLRQHIVWDNGVKKSRLVERITFPVLDEEENVTHLCGIITFMPGSIECPDISVMM